MKAVKQYRTAFKERFNLAGLTALIALSAATLNPLPLLVGLVAEAAYLLFVPDSAWYEARLAKRYDAEVENRRKELKARILPSLSQRMQQRFLRLEEMRQQIAAQTVDQQMWFRQVLRELDYLLEKFLMFASKEMQFRNYLRSVLQEAQGAKADAKKTASGLEKQSADVHQRRSPPPQAAEAARKDARALPDEATINVDSQWIDEVTVEIQNYYDHDLANIERALQQTHDDDTQAILQKRLEVIRRRKEFAGQIASIFANLNHQLRLVEDTFGLINDEICARSPEQILADVEEVVAQTDSMAALLQEVAPYEHAIERIQQAI